MKQKEPYDYRTNFPVNPKANRGSDETKAPFIDNGSGPIPLRRDTIH
jgi:hypothetical protein